MLDKLITYIVWWYKTVYQVLSVAWTNPIATRSDTGSHNRFDMIHSLVPPHYVCIGHLFNRKKSYNSVNIIFVIYMIHKCYLYRGHVYLYCYV